MKIWWQRQSSRVRLAIWNSAAATLAYGLCLTLAMGFHLQDGGGSRMVHWVFGAGGMFAIAGFAVASYLIATKVLRPVSEMAKRTEALSARTPGERIIVDNPHDDLGRLATGFNEVLGRFESAYLDLDRLTADVSHEMRTPLTAIRSVGEVALAENDPEKLRAAIESMLEEIRRLNNMIERLLLLARTDHQDEPVRLEGGLIRPMILEIGELLEPVAAEKGQTITIECPEHLIAAFDPELFKLALTNLVQNGIRYGPLGKPILVRAKQVDDLIEVEVCDSGPGIAAEHHAKIFERFYRVDKARSRKEGGVGLGLAIVKWAVERMGGSVALESEAGRGSAFRLRLRRVQSPG